MRGADDLYLLDAPLPELMRAVTGFEPVRDQSHVRLEPAGIRSTQRLALCDVGGGVAAFTWPAELVEQAEYLYSSGRAARLIDAAGRGQWEIDIRPHLAFWLSRPDDRLYANPRPSMSAEEYVAQWAAGDVTRAGAHDLASVRTELWPWMLERGYATGGDTAELDQFLGRVRKRKRDVHLRPGLRLLRRWPRDEVVSLGKTDLVTEIRSGVNELLLSVDDPELRG